MWWLCIPEEPVPAPPTRPVGFVPLAEYDLDFKYPLASSRVPAPTNTAPMEEGCFGCGPEIVECPDP